MIKPNDGGPAFPCDIELPLTTDPNSATVLTRFPGMTLRQWYAGQALAGMASKLAPNEIEELAEGIRGGSRIAAAANQLADAMLKAREAGQ